jgi:ferric-dicitrate binding protein FerR (iron transport regulator)
VNSAARATVAELAAGERTLRTTIGLEHGELDIRVDHVTDERGVELANDFAVVTPSATLAVRGTDFAVGHDALDGTLVRGAETNSMRAVEITYLESQRRVALARGSVSEASPDPVEHRLREVVEQPNRGVAVADFGERIGGGSAAARGPNRGSSQGDGEAGANAVVVGGEIAEKMGGGRP